MMKGEAKAGEACCAGAKDKAACAMSKGCPMMKGAHAEGYGIVDTAALKAMVNAKVPATIVDARTPQYDDGKRIPGAIYLPADSSDEAIAQALPDKEQLLVAYCSNLKCPASKILAEKLVKLGYKNIVKYPEGLEGWIQAGQAVTEAAKAQ